MLTLSGTPKMPRGCSDPRSGLAYVSERTMPARRDKAPRWVIFRHDSRTKKINISGLLGNAVRGLAMCSDRRQVRSRRAAIRRGAANFALPILGALPAPRTFNFIFPCISFELPPPGGQISLGRRGVGAGRVRGGGRELNWLDAWLRLAGHHGEPVSRERGRFRRGTRGEGEIERSAK